MSGSFTLQSLTITRTKKKKKKKKKKEITCPRKNRKDSLCGGSQMKLITLLYTHDRTQLFPFFKMNHKFISLPRNMELDFVNTSYPGNETL